MSGESDQDSTRYYFVSDLHIGGDETLQEVEFMDEFLTFLRELPERDGMRNSSSTAICSDSGSSLNWKGWRSSTRSSSCIPSCCSGAPGDWRAGPDHRHPGNHDYELACHPEYVDRLAEYNVTLEQEVVITRAGRRPRGLDRTRSTARPEQQESRFPGTLRESAGLPREPPRHEQSRAALGTRAVQLAKGHPVGGADDADSRLDDLPVFLPGDESPSPLHRGAVSSCCSRWSLLYLFAVALDVLGIWSLCRRRRCRSCLPG